MEVELSRPRREASRRPREVTPISGPWRGGARSCLDLETVPDLQLSLQMPSPSPSRSPGPQTVPPPTSNPPPESHRDSSAAS